MATEPQALHQQDLIRQEVVGIMLSTLLEMSNFSVSEENLCIDRVVLMK